MKLAIPFTSTKSNQLRTSTFNHISGRTANLTLIVANTVGLMCPLWVRDKTDALYYAVTWCNPLLFDAAFHATIYKPFHSFI